MARSLGVMYTTVASPCSDACHRLRDIKGQRAQMLLRHVTMGSYNGAFPSTADCPIFPDEAATMNNTATPDNTCRFSRGTQAPCRPVRGKNGSP